MKRPFMQASLPFIVLTIFFFHQSIAQDTRAFNQNASRSNHTRAFNQNSSRSNNAGLSISFGPVYTSPLNKEDDSLLFRGSGTGFRFGADYFFGKAGISFSSGFGSSSPDDASINNFLKRSGIPQDQLIITKARQQNMYLLLGPSIRVGNMVQFSAHAKGGLFINNGGLVNIQQRGANRSVYRNESTDKSVYPGFLTGLNVQYNTKSNIWSFGFSVDYMNTRSEVNNYDIRRGGGMEPLKLSGKITDMVAGITIRYNISSPRDAQSGMASGRRVLPTVNKREIGQSRDAGSGMATGRRQLGKPKYEDMILSNGSSDEGSCGPVTMTKTNPDGTTEEMTFSCPDDAVNYSTRMSTNMSVPKQTQGATFGEKVNAGLHAAGSAVSQGASRGIISGKLTWTTSNTTGIITNAIISNSSPRSGSATLNSQSSSTRTTNQSSFGTMVRMSARETGSGMATGKRSREAGGGLATGRRQYEPIFIENGGSVCNPCMAEVKMASVKNNPLYEQSGNSGTNPLYQGKRTGDDDCDGIANVNVYLVEANSNAIVSKTVTGTCGDFFFANVPDGNYVVKLSGSITAKKNYDVTIASNTDIAGVIEQSGETAQLFINTNTGDNQNMQKAGISTSRSNIRTKSIAIIEADLDGDGEYESLRATATFSDGSSRDITSAVSKAAGSKSISINGNALQATQANAVNKISSLSIKNSEGRHTATGTFSDGSSRDITNDITINTAHNGVKQYNINIGDLDGDGAAEAVIKTKTKSNQSNDRIAVGNIEEDDIWSPRSNIKMLNVATGDLDGDGLAETIIGGALPGGGVISAAKAGDPVHGVDIKPGIITNARPGSPIGGLSIKGGKNPGGNLRTTQTSEYGEFEFTGLEAGSYTFTLDQYIIIEDETFVSVATTEENFDSPGIAQTKAQDHNSSRSNKTASVQDHNSSRSNKTASNISADPDNNTDPSLKLQNNNTVRSNRTDNALLVSNKNNDDAVSPAKWTAPESMQKTINTTRDNIKSMLASLDELEQQLDADQSNDKSVINNSRTNINNQRTRINELEQTLNRLQQQEKNIAMKELEQKRNETDIQFLKLQRSLKEMGQKYSSISNVLKTKHDIAMNSIRNMK